MSDILIGSADGQQQRLLGAMANRHGLVAGATGTGKTVTLQVLAEGFSRLGVPVFSADIKGDLSGISAPGSRNVHVDDRLQRIGIDDWAPDGAPTRLWDIFGESGQPVRTTVADMGPALLANLLELNDTQTGLLHLAFDYADKQSLPLLDLPDLEAVLNWMLEHRRSLSSEYGSLSPQSLGAIVRRVLVLKTDGGEVFFGEPALDIHDLMAQSGGRGVVNLLDGRRLMMQPRVYTTFLLWLLAELFEQLPERGDQPLPLLVFFFDESHLLFDNAPPALLEKLEQTVRLIRSKGVGIYFVTQSPADIPDSVLGQLGNRIQHALRAYTPRDQKAVKAAAQTFRANPALDTERVITELGVGEALVSMLDEQGVPAVVQKTLIAPPRSRIGPVDDAALAALRDGSPLASKYGEAVDRDSAHERLKKRRETLAKETSGKAEPEKEASLKRSRRQSPAEAFTKSFLRSFATQFSRFLVQFLKQMLKTRR
ncbi:helicase HerA-like domain-containing protein [Marinobacter sp. JSM 1782161]|uniref:helicase HerA-like domain-containing protein n=1 Tax=Marinobacter sp. JSM 1782161 TaxID=2685906 RepID=UPI001403E9CC|nr:helicase HerA-like domain-containing protein [Marinobacter sp. JSM 1782161]